MSSSPDTFINIYMEDDETSVLQLRNFDTFKNAKPQYFDFPDTIIHYLLSNSTLKIYEKLIKSCKYFYYKKKVLIFFNVCSLSTRTRNRKDRFTFHSDQLPQIWLNYYLWLVNESNPNLISNFCSKIYKCEAIVVYILKQHITEEEFHFLVQPGFVISLCLDETSVLNKTKNGFLSIEEIVERVPNAHAIQIPQTPCTSNTLSILTNLKRNTKFKFFLFQCGFPSHEYFDLNVFLKFIAKQSSPEAYYEVNLGDLEVEHYFEYEKKTNEFADTWDPIEEKPTIYISINRQRRARSERQTKWESLFTK